MTGQMDDFYLPGHFDVEISMPRDYWRRLNKGSV